jgi:hypothetical protein
MSRSVKEWIGKTDNTPVPARVKVRVFERYNGICYLSGRKITAADKWDCDHKIALINRGENRENNLAPVLKDKHKEKTKKDVAIKSKNYQVKKKHLGVKKRSSFPCSKSSPFKKKISGEVVRRDT